MIHLPISPVINPGHGVTGHIRFEEIILIDWKFQWVLNHYKNEEQRYPCKSGEVSEMAVNIFCDSSSASKSFCGGTYAFSFNIFNFFLIGYIRIKREFLFFVSFIHRIHCRFMMI